MSNVILEEQIKQAMASGRQRLRQGPLALGAVISDEMDELILTLSSGEVLRLPTNQLQGLAEAPSKALRNVEIVSGGLGLHWEELDADLLVPELVRGIYGTQSWMRAIGERGGKARTNIKSQAARDNGAKGGRPRTSKARLHGKCYILSVENKVVNRRTQWVGVLRANNGRSLLQTEVFSEKNAVVDCWNAIKRLAINDHLCFERQEVDTRWQFEIRTCDGKPLGVSAPYASKSTASRAQTMLSAAIGVSRFDEPQLEGICR